MKKMLVSVMLVCLLAFSLLAGISCTTMKMSGIEVAQKASTGSKLGTFDINVRITKFLGWSAGPTLFNLFSDATDPAIVNAIKAEITKLGGSKAVDVKIEYEASIIHILLNAITWGIYAPQVAHVTGTVIR